MPSASVSVPKKCAMLGRIVAGHADRVIDTLAGSMTLGEAIVREATPLAQKHTCDSLQSAFRRNLMRDGYILFWDSDYCQATLRAALPSDIQLPEADDEVRQLLKGRKFETTLGHMKEAIEAHTRGDWAAANGQIQTFVESLFKDIAQAIAPNERQRRASSKSRLDLLTSIGFLSPVRNEWTGDGNGFINGLFKMLHTDGPQPGLSDEEHCTFRLHLAMVTARTFLRRLHFENWKRFLSVETERPARAAETVIGFTNKDLPDDNRESTAAGYSTVPGYVNRNNQIVIRKTSMPGNDHNQYVYVLHCAGL